METKETYIPGSPVAGILSLIANIDAGVNHFFIYEGGQPDPVFISTECLKLLPYSHVVDAAHLGRVLFAKKVVPPKIIKGVEVIQNKLGIGPFAQFKKMTKTAAPGLLSRQGRDGSPDRLAYAVYANKDRPPQVRFIIGRKLLKKSGLVRGDRIAVHYDTEYNMGRIMKEECGQSRIIGRGKSPKGPSLIGFSRTNDEFPLTPNGLIELEEVVAVTDGGILFAWPKAEAEKC